MVLRRSEGIRSTFSLVPLDPIFNILVATPDTVIPWISLSDSIRTSVGYASSAAKP